VNHPLLAAVPATAQEQEKGKESAGVARTSAVGPEERFTDANTGATGNTLVSVDAGVKYKGFFRLNVQFQRVNRSPVSSTFGYYVGGQKGNTFSKAFSVYF